MIGHVPARVALAALALALVAAPAAHADLAEIATVTTNQAIATWNTQAPADTTVCWGRNSATELCRREEEGAIHHYAVMVGLAPGTAYRYELRSAGEAQPFSQTNPGSFTTLTPPPGRHLFDFALMSDLHVGESCAGTAFSAPLLGTSVPPCFSAPDYAAQMDAAEVAEIADRGIGLTVIDGDVTSEARRGETLQAKDILAGLGGKVLVARGNHDRPHPSPTETQCGADDDCFREIFYPARAPGRIYGSANYQGYHFVMLDSSDSAGTGNLADAGQNAWLAADLASHRSAPTFVFFHHPASEYADFFELEPVIFGVRPYLGGTEFLNTVAANPQIVGVLQAHTHRNFNSYGSHVGPRVPFVENGTAKEYPGGYSVFSVYEGGYTRSFFRPGDCAFCREWTTTTAGEFFGLAPLYLLGSVGTRNFTHPYECDAELPATTLPGNDSLTGPVLTPPKRCLDRVYPPSPGVVASGLSFSLGARRLTIRGGRGATTLRCRGGGTCIAAGKLTITRRFGRGRGRHTRIVRVATVTGRVNQPRTGALRVTLTRAARLLFAQHHPLRVLLRATVRNPIGARRGLVTRLVLAAPARRRARH